MRDHLAPYRDDPPKPDTSTALEIAFWVFMVGMLLVSTLMVAGDQGRGVGAMPSARATHEPSLVSQSRPSVSVPIAEARS